MDILNAIILGIVEGLTEFLPISSTGHLLITQDLIGFHDASRMFTIVIQMGAVVAVMWFYRQKLIDLARGILNGEPKARRFFLVWVVATLPAVIAGLLLESIIETKTDVVTVGWALMIGGVVIWLIERYKHISPSADHESFERITLKQAVLVGLYQVVALVPGVSRSGATIMGGLLSGLDRVTATAFSFFLGIPILLMAGVYKLLTEDTSTIAGGGVGLVFGTITAFISALVVVKWLLRYVSKHDFRFFAYYRVALGVIILLILK